MSDRNQSPAPWWRSIRRLRGAFWRRRVIQGIVRSLWLALLVPTVLVAGYLWHGWQIQDHLTRWLWVTLGVGLASLLWSLRPVSLSRLIPLLDRRMGLRERLQTALEVSQGSATGADSDNPVVQRLFQETVRIAIVLRKRVRVLDRNFWLEMQTLLAVVVLLGAMLMLGALNPRVPDATPAGLPDPWQEPAADQVLPPNATLFPPPGQQPVAVQAQSAEGMQEALQALAEALRDPAVTHGIAEAIERGDLGEAAAGLRRLADQLDQLSPQAQQELGQALGQAAGEIGDAAPELSQPLQRGSQALERGDLDGAREALEQLAEALDAAQEAPAQVAEAPAEGQTGEQTGGEASGEAQGEAAGQGEGETGEEATEGEEEGNASGGAGAGEEGGADQPTEAERLGIEGQPLELESEAETEERVVQPGDPDATAGEGEAGDRPFTRHPLGAAAGDLGPDPLTYPWEKRDIVRRYFTP